ncbi:MAG: 23S rRNA pseudouridine synthase [Spirochaetes bacterium]|nr:MAG: 23S rRNA pseudouridine synthase [Spirochaetota bacterium]
MKDRRSRDTPIPAHWTGMAVACRGERADKYLSETLKLMTRSQLKARNATLKVNGREEKLSRKLKEGDRLELSWESTPSQSFDPEDLEVSILFENSNVIVFDKAQGMVTHPGAGHWGGTLANAALFRAKLSLDMESKEALPPRGGIVHRLDKDTSGVIIVAKNADAHGFLAEQFKQRLAKKEYIAILRGFPAPERGRIENYLGRDKKDRKKFAISEKEGKHALTDYRILKSWTMGEGSRYCVAALYPRTGRTHQLRIHMAGLGCPILGDPIYGKKDARYPEATLMLHARRLKIRLPGEEAWRVFSAPMPGRFKEILAKAGQSG